MRRLEGIVTMGVGGIQSGRNESASWSTVFDSHQSIKKSVCHKEVFSTRPPGNQDASGGAKALSSSFFLETPIQADLTGLVFELANFLMWIHSITEC